MKQFSFLHFFVAITCLTVFSCKKKDDTVDLHQDYFGFEQGRYVIYEVMTITHDNNSGVHDTVRYQIKAQVGDTVIDNEGRIAREYIRSYYDDITGVYVPKDLWTGFVDQNRAELVEENQRRIKMVFAPTKFKEWDANAYNNKGTLNCYYSRLHEPFSVNGFSFDSTVTVEQDSVYNLVQFKRRYEIYAKNVGLIRKRDSDLVIKNFDYLNPDKGTEMYMTLIGYGKE